MRKTPICRDLSHCRREVFRLTARNSVRDGSGSILKIVEDDESPEMVGEARVTRGRDRMSPNQSGSTMTSRIKAGWPSG